jgi:hypothetical protein
MANQQETEHRNRTSPQQFEGVGTLEELRQGRQRAIEAIKQWPEYLQRPLKESGRFPQ